MGKNMVEGTMNFLQEIFMMGIWIFYNFRNWQIGKRNGKGKYRWADG